MCVKDWITWKYFDFFWLFFFWNSAGHGTRGRGSLVETSCFPLNKLISQSASTLCTAAENFAQRIVLVAACFLFVQHLKERVILSVSMYTTLLTLLPFKISQLEEVDIILADIAISFHLLPETKNAVSTFFFFTLP